MSTPPFFSVIIPLYNKEAYIEYTLKSILAQSFEDFEIIIVNDGSTDNSITIVNTFNDPRINVIQQINNGLSASRNTGISKAIGEVIALIDADDLWHEDFLKSIYNLYQKFPDISFYGTDYLEKYGAKTIETKKNLNSDLRSQEFIVEDFFVSNKFQPIISQSSIAFKRSIVKEDLFDETIGYAEDVDFYLKIFTKYKLAYLFSPKVSILCNIPNQITTIGIKGKTIPNLNIYEKNYPNDKSLKQYLDFKRYMYAIQYKLIRDTSNYKKHIKHIEFKNLSFKQVVLLKSPLAVLKCLKAIKKLFLKHNIRLTSFRS